MQIQIPFLNQSFEEFKMCSQYPHSISNNQWLAYTNFPAIVFVIFHNENSILLKYRINEKHIRAVNTALNELVYEDSCVEFFISFNNGETYYNFEFNCLGNLLAGYGTGKVDRVLLDEPALKKIKTESVIAKNALGEWQWTLAIEIPVSAFSFNSIKSLKDMEGVKGNFYKCGDKLPEPHFLTWNEIKNDEPNFHLPTFFGDFLFK